MREDKDTFSGGDRTASTAPGGERGGSVGGLTPDDPLAVAESVTTFLPVTPGQKAAPDAFEQAYIYGRRAGLAWYDAEDFASDVVLEVLGMESARFDEQRGPFGALLATVLRRRLSNRLRARLRYSDALARFEQNRMAERLAEEPPEIAARREQVTALHEAIAHLPAEHYDLLTSWLRGEHRTQRAFAQSLGKSAGWVSKKLREAREELADALGGEDA